MFLRNTEVSLILVPEFTNELLSEDWHIRKGTDLLGPQAIIYPVLLSKNVGSIKAINIDRDYRTAILELLL